MYKDNVYILCEDLNEPWFGGKMMLYTMLERLVEG